MSPSILNPEWFIAVLFFFSCRFVLVNASTINNNYCLGMVLLRVKYRSPYAWTRFFNKTFCFFLKVLVHHHHHQHHHPILIRVYPINRGGRIYPTLTAISSTPTLHRSIQGIFLLQLPTLLLSVSTCVFHVFVLWSSLLPLAFTSNSSAFLKTCPSYPSLTHACMAISLHSPLPSELLFPSIPTSPAGKKIQLISKLTCEQLHSLLYSK